MLEFISLIICFICVLLGYFKPKFVAYFILYTTPILSPGRLVLIPSSTLPLEYIIFAFSLTFGITLNPIFNRRISSISLKSFQWIYGLLLMIFLLLLSTDSEYITTILFFDIPLYYTSVVIPLFLINNFKDLDSLITVLVWQGALIGVFAVLAFFDIFRITYWLRLTVPDYNMDIIQDTFRAGTRRIHGLDGSASQTASRLVFLYFLSIWYLLKRNKIINYIPMILIFIGLILLQTRAAFLALFAGLLYLFLTLGYKKLIDIKIIKIIFQTVVIVTLTFISISFIRNIFSNFIFEYLLPTIASYDNSVEVKVERIPVAFELAIQNFFTGYGSREYIYHILMYTDDIPTPLIYMLSGGILLLITHLYVYLYPIYKTLNLSKSTDKKTSRYLVIVSTALSVGFFMTLTNWLETHRMIMIMVFIASYKYVLIKNKKKYILIKT